VVFCRGGAEFEVMPLDEISATFGFRDKTLLEKPLPAKFVNRRTMLFFT